MNGNLETYFRLPGIINLMEDVEPGTLGHKPEHYSDTLFRQHLLGDMGTPSMGK